MSITPTRRAFIGMAAAAACQSRVFGRTQDGFDRIRRVEIDGYAMAYRETGAGAPLVFWHGNPTSSFLWRKVAPVFAAQWRCIAPDLLGMGHSPKARAGEERRYTVAGQRRLVDQVLNRLGVFDRVVLVAHDWGGTLAFDWARRHPDAVAGIVHMETFVEPHAKATTPEAVWRWFERYRGVEGERAVLEENEFVEKVLLGQLPNLTAEERDTYRAPFRHRGADRLPTLTWPRQVPLDGDPADVHEIQEAGWHFMARSPIPKLFINAEPGALVVQRRRMIARSWPHTTEATVSSGHFVPEDAPTALVEAMRSWLVDAVKL